MIKNNVIGEQVEKYKIEVFQSGQCAHNDEGAMLAWIDSTMMYQQAAEVEVQPRRVVGRSQISGFLQSLLETRCTSQECRNRGQI